jgi:hypothetical protein
MASTNAQAEWTPVTAHAETPQHLVEIITPSLAVPIRRTRRDRLCAPVGGLLIRSLAGERRRLLGQPRRREGLDLQGLECERTTPPVQMHRKQRGAALPQPLIMERRARQARREEGEHPTVLPPSPDRREGLRAIDNGQEQGGYATATGEAMRGGRRAEGIEERSDGELAPPPSTKGTWATGLL